MSTPATLDAARRRQEELRRRLVEIGFDEVRFATVRELGGERLHAWLAAGHHADMQWMERTAEKRLKPGLVQAEARSVIMLGVSYADAGRDAEGAGRGERAGRATWARYALHEDYHDTMKAGLVAAGREVSLVARRELAELTVREILALTPARFAEVFRRTPIKRVKLGGLLRNACVVAGNSGDESLIEPLVRLATTHELPLVRAHAVWAVRKLGGEARASTVLNGARAAETDAEVLAEYAAVTV